MPNQSIQGPAWDLSDEYTSPDAPEVAEDLESLGLLMDGIELANKGLADVDPVPAAQAVYKLSVPARKLLANLSTYANCRLSVSSGDDLARNLQGTLQNYSKRFGDLMEPLSQFTDLTDEAHIAAYLQDPEVAVSEFTVRHSRKRRHQVLSLAEENLVNALSQDGIHAWGSLYSQLSGTIKAQVLSGNETREMGLAEASGQLMSGHDSERRNAWIGINAAWETHQDSCAAAVNAIAGWRLEMCKRRSRSQPVHYLDAPVHQNRISRQTLDALMSVAERAAPLARRAALLQARAYGKERFGPWDLRAPAPVVDSAAGGSPIEFSDAVDIIADAYSQVDVSLGEFVRMMVDKRWVEATVGPDKRPGAYCTQFAKSRTPRVYMTFTGGASDVITLAHELGHAYHGWVMRDLPPAQTSYGMSLAETASTFGETLVRDALLARASTPAERLDILWEEISALTTFVLNIPARYEFESQLLEARAERPLRAAELKEMMGAAYNKWYGTALAEPDPMFWASKLHFYISGLSFYNFPYLFGYLFSLGIYSRRGALGDEFFNRYQSLLRDTGRMTAEQLATQHLSSDLTTEDFWQHSIDGIAPKVDAFAEVLNELGIQGA